MKTYYLSAFMLFMGVAVAQETYTFDCGGQDLTISAIEYEVLSSIDANEDGELNDLDLQILFNCDSVNNPDFGDDNDFEDDFGFGEDINFEDFFDSLGVFDWNYFNDFITLLYNDSLEIDAFDENFFDTTAEDFFDSEEGFDWEDFNDSILFVDNDSVEIDNVFEDFFDSEGSFDWDSFNDTISSLNNYFDELNAFDEVFFDFVNSEDFIFDEDLLDNLYLFNGINNSSNDESQKRQLLEIRDLQGKSVQFTPNQILFYIYNDGTIEKRMTLDR